MAAQAQRKNPGAFEVAVVARPTPLSSHAVTEAAVSPPGLEAQYPLRPQVFIPHPASEFLSGEATMHETSPRFLPRNVMQSAQQSMAYHAGSAGGCDQLGPFQHEDMVGMLGDRIGSASDMSVASEKIYSSNSALGEQTGERVKFMCSFGGRILPRPGDGKLRYAGGDTRIISIYRHTRYSDLIIKMKQLYGLNVSLKYQLPNEDLDALISVSCDEDVENMMEEYDRLQTSDSSSKLRIFLFPSSDHDLGHLADVTDERTTEKVYVDAINGINEFQGTRSLNVVPTGSSSNLVGLEPTENRSISHQAPLNMQHGVPNIPTSHVLTSMLSQPAPLSMLQANMQPLPRILSASPSAPSSPTIVSTVAQVRHPVLPDISHQFYPADQLVKDPPGTLHGIQRPDIAHQEMESVKSGVMPLGPQHDIPVWPVESRKASDSPTKAQYETRMGHFLHQDQSIMSDPHIATGIPIAVFPRVDSHGAMPRVVSQTNLVLPQVQQLETGVVPLSIGKVLDNQQQATILHSPLELQNIVMQEQLPSAQVSRQHGLETAFQKVEPTRFPPHENLQAIMRPPQQQFPPQYYTPIVTSSHEITGCNQLEVLPGRLPPNNLAIQTSIYPSGVGVLHSGSTPSSPRVGIKDSNLDMNVNMIQQYAPEQPHLKIAAQAQMELPMKGLKPLNMQVDNKDQLFSVDDRITRKNLPISVMKTQDNREGTDVQQYFPEGSVKPRIPPYVGSSPYGESLSPFADNQSIQGGGHGQRQPEDGCLLSAQYQEPLSQFSDVKVGRWDGHRQTQREDGLAYSQFGEGVDLSLNRQHGEGVDFSLNKQPVWNQFSQLEKTDESNTNINLVGINDDNSSDALKSSLCNTGIGLVNLQKTNTMLTNTVETLPKLDPVTLLGFVQPAHLDGSSTFSNPLSANTFDDSNSLFAAKMEDGQWLKGTESDIQTKSNVGRNVVAEDAFGTTENPFFVDSLSGHLNDVKIYPKHDSSGLYVGVNTVVDKTHAVDPKIEQTLLVGASPLEVADLQKVPSSPRVAAAKLQMSRPVHCFTEEETTSANYLTEGSKYFHNQNLISSAQTKEFGTGVTSFENVTFPDLRDDLSSTTQISEGQRNVPLFDSDFVQENMNKNRGSGDLVPKTVEEALTSSLLYPVPTLSVQKWEDTLASIELEDERRAKDLHDDEKRDELQLDSILAKVSEIKVDDESDDTNVDESNKHLNLAAVAEAEAIARGLQTIKNADLEELRELGTGTFGTVYHGKWKGTDVAIKRIKSSCFSGRPSERERLIADFWNEAYMLGQLHHPNVVAFYGVVPDGPDGTLATVTEYMVNGSLKQVLQKKDRTIDRRKRLLIIMDAAFGMEYLHGKKIIHFDLKCENLLVNMKDPQRPICKIGDLGLSKVKRQTMVSGGVRGTLPWMAPELLNGSSNLVSEKVDVFSFAIVMWELLTGEEPYADMHYGAIIGGIVNNTLRPSIPSWCDPAWKSLMEQCWATDPAERPSFVEISAELRAMANSKS